MRNSYESATQLACHIGKIPLPPAVASENGQTCALSGVHVPAGTLNLVPWTPGDKYRDHYDIVDRDAEYVTQETSAILSRPFMQRYSKSVISTDGWFGFATTNNVAWFLLRPPKPPFVMIFGLAQMEHLLWRTPLSLSRELFFVRLGHRTLRIRHARLLSIVSQLKPCTDAVNAFAEHEGQTAINGPFLPIARELNTDTSGQLHPRVLQAATANIEEARRFVDEFRKLSSGELWALGRIHAARDLDLVQPEPLIIKP